MSDHLPRYTMNDLKKAAKSFLDRIPSATTESLENGWKMFSLIYMNTQMDDRERESEGPALFRIIHQRYVDALSNVAQ